MIKSDKDVPRWVLGGHVTMGNGTRVAVKSSELLTRDRAEQSKERFIASLPSDCQGVRVRVVRLTLLDAFVLTVNVWTERYLKRKDYR